jgi:WD40 repeat protein
VCYKVATGEAIRSVIRHDDSVHAVAFAGTSDRLISAGWDRTIRRWKITEIVEQEQVSSHTARALCLATTRDGNVVVSGGGPGDGRVRIWNTNDLSIKTAFKADTMYVEQIVFLSQDRLALTRGSESGIQLWDWNNEKLVRNIGNPLPSPIRSLVILPEKNQVLAGHQDCQLRTWSIATGDLCDIIGSTAQAIDSMSITNDTTLLAVATSADPHGTGFIELWNTNTWSRLVCVPLHTARITCVAFSIDGNLLATASVDKSIKLWNVPSLIKEQVRK